MLALSCKRWLSDVCEVKGLTFDYLLDMRGDDLIDRRSDRSKEATDKNGVWRPMLESVNLLKPRTFMNRSGLAAGPALSDLRLRADDRNSVLVVCDDLTIPLGQLRMKPGGSSGGQNGLDSIIKVTRTEEVARLRIGMGKRMIGGSLEKVKPSLALGKLNAEEQALFYEVSKYAAQVIRVWLFRGFDLAVNLANTIKLDRRDERA
ncbi:Peptidyl-tRNA hydrolase, putative [Perkinsus marinus ATCC 50983]|uniref:Peptidyl-tRNA hydrolase, putative n=1 Tax=Perkinsus marinus (strain ATCC 50983 / TXsc) TaxID=423536 RepID=C5LRV0_PERM5|nr:Peptidyl-tRNA hydrolase, putative [Perkinsus marinus ATCC 50983]EER00543.1 Peptidyl-tRNA hydrolase, putative [Perkinsus marinus ATCC 50983]|eukprot:XP_002767825.1 Peptidyl-tRNA hydrolase, putative [Perkinsus marinus ATCC 50983]